MDDLGGDDDIDVLSMLEPALVDEPDALGLVCEVADLMAVFAADRFRRVHAMHGEALADATRRGRQLTDVVERGIRLELAAALRVTEYVADRMLRLAEALVERYAVVLDALSGARVTERHAELLADELDACDEGVRAEVLVRALPLAESQPVGQFRRSLRRIVEEEGARTLAERHTTAVARRRVVVEPAEDGMAWLMTLMPAVEARAVFERATRMARVLVAREGEERTLDQARADVIGDLLVDGDVAAYPAEARGVRATVAVTVPALALLDAETSSGDGGASGESAGASGSGGSGVAVVEGVGPIPLRRARELCGAAGDWMRVLTHPETGAVLSVGRHRYRPPESLRALARWRAERCMAPGCGVPASRCEIDHTVAWEDGGDTRLGNLAPLCTGHHRVKHHGGWSVRQLDGSGGALEWVSPMGRRYVVEPERRVPVFRPGRSGADADARGGHCGGGGPPF